MLEPLIATGIVMGFMLVVAFFLNDRHQIYKLFCLFYATVLVIYVPFSVLDNQNVCTHELSNFTRIANTTDNVTTESVTNTYAQVCFTKEYKSNETLIGINYAFLGITLLYWVIIGFVAIFKWFKSTGKMPRQPKGGPGYE